MFLWLCSLVQIPASIFRLSVAFVSYALHLGLPKIRGTVFLPGLRKEVKITRDQWGIPHIAARNNHDLFFTLGYAHAQDRLWQMEFSRRIASGTLSEILGEDALAVDRFMRRIGLYRTSASQIGSVRKEIRLALEAYSRGVNAYVEHTPWWRLPLEYILLGVRPKPWTIVDSAAISKLVAWMISPNWDTEVVRLRLIERFGPDVLAVLEPSYPEGGLLAAPPGLAYQKILDSTLGEYQRIAAYLPQYGASNAWAVDGTKSVSGKPLLACDPHLPASMPSFWYEAHLSSPHFNVIGVSVAGVPAVIAGHNQQVAWGVSSGLVDQSDVYIERLNPDNPHEYLYEGDWRTGETSTECIIVRGKANPVYEDVFLTHHGPVISPVIEGEKRVLSLRSVTLESLGLLEAGYGLMTVKNWNEFRSALKLWGSPSLNFVYADREGNIGYQLAGFVPVRNGRSGRIPSLGWEAKNGWAGFIPFEDLPSVFNPPSHFVASANNMVSQTTPQGVIEGEWADPYRMCRIVELLISTQRHSLDDFRGIQQDVHAVPAEEFLSYFSEIEMNDTMARKAIALLKEWDFSVNAESAAAAIYEVFAYFFYKNLFSIVFGEHVSSYMGKGIHEMAHINALGYRVESNLLRVLRNPPSVFGNDWEKTKREVSETSMKEALSYLRKFCGRDMSKWQWGKIHTVTFPHVLARKRILRRIFSRGPYPVDGDMNTIPQASYDPMNPFSCTASIVSYRQIIDLADLTKSVAVNSTGASGQPASSHFGDQIPLWRNFEYHPMLFCRRDIRDNTKAVLVARPSPEKSS